MKLDSQTLLAVSIATLPIGVVLIFIPGLRAFGIVMLAISLLAIVAFLYTEWNNYEHYKAMREARRKQQNQKMGRAVRKSERTLRYLEAFVNERIDRVYRDIDPEDLRDN